MKSNNRNYSDLPFLGFFAALLSDDFDSELAAGLDSDFDSDLLDDDELDDEELDEEELDDEPESAAADFL